MVEMSYKKVEMSHKMVEMSYKKVEMSHKGSSVKSHYQKCPIEKEVVLNYVIKIYS